MNVFGGDGNLLSDLEVLAFLILDTWDSQCQYSLPCTIFNPKFSSANYAVCSVWVFTPLILLYGSFYLPVIKIAPLFSFLFCFQWCVGHVGVGIVIVLFLAEFLENMVTIFTTLKIKLALSWYKAQQFIRRQSPKWIGTRHWTCPLKLCHSTGWCVTVNP